MHCLVTDSKLSQKSWYAPSISVVSGGGNLSTDSPVRRQKRFQSALRKFQPFTGSLWTGTLSFGGVMRDGRCCDRGNFPRTCLSGSRLSWPKLSNARSGLVPTFHRWEKLACFLWVIQKCKVVGCCPGVQALSVRRCFVVTTVDMSAVEVTNIQTGVWERWGGLWCESRAWRFVDVNDFKSCDVYAQPLSHWWFWRLIDQWPFQPLMDKRGKALVPVQDWPG